MKKTVLAGCISVAMTMSVLPVASAQDDIDQVEQGVAVETSVEDDQEASPVDALEELESLSEQVDAELSETVDYDAEDEVFLAASESTPEQIKKDAAMFKELQRLMKPMREQWKDRQCHFPGGIEFNINSALRAKKVALQGMMNNLIDAYKSNYSRIYAISNEKGHPYQATAKIFVDGYSSLYTNHYNTMTSTVETPGKVMWACRNWELVSKSINDSHFDSLTGGSSFGSSKSEKDDKKGDGKGSSMDDYYKKFEGSSDGNEGTAKVLGIATIVAGVLALLAILPGVPSLLGIGGASAGRSAAPGFGNPSGGGGSSLFNGSSR